MVEKDNFFVLRDVSKVYARKRGFFGRPEYFYALSRINLTISRGEILGIIGESGSGKSTLARLLLRLEEPTSGEIIFNDKIITKIKGKELKDFRRSVQLILQDPFSSLNPKKRIGEILREPFIIHGETDTKRNHERLLRILEAVGLDESALNKYPHEFSGGQRQRISIARALTLSPTVLIADEPTSSLDVSIQAQILNLFMDIFEKETRDKRNFTLVIISHDLDVIKFLCHRIVVILSGQIVEVLPKERFSLEFPHHPYTTVLLNSHPSPFNRILACDKKNETSARDLKGDDACPFLGRCSFGDEICLKLPENPKEISDGHYVYCHHVENKIG